MKHLSLRSALALIVCLSSLIGCSSGGSDVGDGSSGLAIDQSTLSSATSANGLAAFEFVPPAGSTAFQLVGLSGQGALIPQSLINSRGQEIIGLSSQGTTQAKLSTVSPSSLNFPFLNGVVESGTYRAGYKLNSGVADADISMLLLSKRDSDSRNGTLKVNFISVGAAADSSDIREDLEGVVGIVKELFARAGISIDPQWSSFDGATELPDPRTGARLYEVISSAVRPYAVNVIFAGKVKGLKGDDRYAVAGAAPGPAVPSVHSAVLVDLLEVTGGDGQFQTDSDSNDDRPSGHNDEIRLCAEEIARSVARYLGLENNVEFRGGDVIRTDSLSDTESCIKEIQCREQGSARTNLMMPRPLRESSRENNGNDFYAREDISEQQRIVLNNSILVD